MMSFNYACWTGSPEAHPRACSCPIDPPAEKVLVTCPDCGISNVPTSRCFTCPACGWSKCG